MHRVVGPVGDRHHGQPSGVGHHELDVVGVGSAAALIDDDDRLTEFADPHLQVSVGRFALARPGDRDLDWLLARHVLRDGDDRGVVERGECLRGNAISRHTGLAETVVSALHCFDGDARTLRNLDGGAAGCLRGPVMQAAQPLERCEPPDLVTPVRHLEGVDIE